MELLVDADPQAVARRAAAFIAAEARTAAKEQGRFILAVSGGRTPALMLRALATQSMPWDVTHIVQVDERIAPEGSPERNLTDLREALLASTPLKPTHIHPMPVDNPDLDAAASAYAQTLHDLAGSPPTLDLIHLGLGADGHTASLIPADPVLNATTTDVALTGPYQGRRRMTLTYPILNRAKRILWLVTGSEKTHALQQLLTQDPTIPAGRVNQEHALALADQAAAQDLGA